MSRHDEATALARSIFELRQMRAHHLPAAALSEVAWNILLALFVADADGSRMIGHDVLKVAEIEAPTGQRWIMALHAEGLVIGDGRGNLNDVIALTPTGISAVEACMIDAQRHFQTRPPRSTAS